jgi:hypothetical protein
LDTGTPTTGGTKPLKQTVKQAVKKGLGHHHLVEIRDAIDGLTAELRELRETLRAVSEADEEAMALVGRLLTRLDARIEAIESGEDRLAAPRLGAPD